MQPWTWVAPWRTAASELATAHPPSLWKCPPMVTDERAGTSDTMRSTSSGMRAAVGVAQHERLGSRLLGGGEDRQREGGVAPVAVEEVLGVEEHAQARAAQEGDRVGRHGDRLVQAGAQRLGDVQVGGLGDDADHLGARPDEMPQRLVLGAPWHPSARVEPKATRVAVPSYELLAPLWRRTPRPWGWRRASRLRCRRRRDGPAARPRAACPRR